MCDLKTCTKVILLLATLMLIFYIQGCTSFKESITAVRDPNLTEGCKVVGINVGFDSYFDTTKGNTEVCKLVCSKKLPDNFLYEYDNPRNGCHVKVGNIK